MVAWRAAGLNYVRFSQIAAEVTRNCTKAAAGKGKAAGVKAEATLKIATWENGKLIKKAA